MALLTSFMANCAIACFLISSSARAPENAVATPKQEKVTPRWRVDLRPTIAGVPLGRVVGRGHETQGKPVSSLWFLDDNRIVVTFVTREAKSTFSNRAAPDDSSPLRLRAILLDAASGKVMATPTWPSRSRFAKIVAVHDGRFVTQTGAELTLYSQDLTEVGRLALPLTESEWAAHSSPTGKNILFLAGGFGNLSPVPWVWVDTDRLKVLRSWEDVRTGYVGISDDKIVMDTCVWFQECEPSLKARDLDTGWKVIMPTLPTYGVRDAPRPQFVNDDLVLLLGSRIELVRADGTVVFAQDRFSGGCWSDEIPPAARRFAVPTCKLKGNLPALDMGGYHLLQTILLFDVPFHGLSFVLRVEGPRIKGLTQFAISPDGSKLAILNDEAIEVLQLPPLL
jgi:hypothetical protein